MSTASPELLTPADTVADPAPPWACPPLALGGAPVSAAAETDASWPFEARAATSSTRREVRSAAPIWRSREEGIPPLVTVDITLSDLVWRDLRVTSTCPCRVDPGRDSWDTSSSPESDSRDSRTVVVLAKYTLGRMAELEADGRWWLEIVETMEIGTATGFAPGTAARSWGRPRVSAGGGDAAGPIPPLLLVRPSTICLTSMARLWTASTAEASMDTILRWWAPGGAPAPRPFGGGAPV